MRENQIERRRRQLQKDLYNLEQQIERQLDRQEREVGTDRCIQLRTIDREIVRQTGGGGGGRYRQMNIAQNNRQREIERQRDSKIDRRRRQVQIDVYNLEQQIKRQLDREQEEVGTNRCKQHRTIDREIVRKRRGGGTYRQMYTT